MVEERFWEIMDSCVWIVIEEIFPLRECYAFSAYVVAVVVFA